jgi:Domain of unknown function (DUF4126)
MNPLLLGTASAFGLAVAAGLNTTLPLLIVGLLARFGLLGLAPPYDALSSDVTLAGLLLLALLEIVGDKVPGLDSIVQAIQWPLAAAAGAILFASQASVVSWVSPGLAILVGLLTAGAVHGARTAVRPMVTALTAGLGNTAVSALEDASAVALAATSALLPMVALILLVALGALAVVGGRRAMLRGTQRAHKLRTGAPGAARSA